MRRNKKLTVMLVLVILVMCLTVGYAVLSTTLNINGTSTIGNARWDIHFENIQVEDGSVTAATSATINSAKDTVTYVINLAKPGDYYEFTVDIKNAGTIDGMVESITSKINNQPITNKPVYLDYYVTYNDGIEIEPNHLLSAGLSEKIKVHVGFSTDISASDLPGSSQTYTLTLNLKETQATSDAVPKPYYVYTTTGNELSIGSAIPNNVTVYDSYEDDNYDMGYIKTFIRLKIQNDIIQEAYVGYHIDDPAMAGMTAGDYYLKGGDGGTSYTENQSVLFNSYGSVNCTINQQNTSCGYPYVQVFTDGGVSLYASGGVGCHVYSTGRAVCH